MNSEGRILPGTAFVSRDLRREFRMGAGKRESGHTTSLHPIPTGVLFRESKASVLSPYRDVRPSMREETRGAFNNIINSQRSLKAFPFAW